MLRQSDYSSLSDADLVELLFTEADRLPRSAVDEFIRRGEKIVPDLGEIISFDGNWKARSPEWWAVIHAVYILGAIGTEAVIPYLVKSITLAEKYEVDWVWDELPSIFGKIGPAALDSLQKIAGNKSKKVMVRETALNSMASVTIKYPAAADRVFDFLIRIVRDESDHLEARSFTGSILMNFQKKEYREDLLHLARLQKKVFDETGEMQVFYDNEVKEALGEKGPRLYHYTRDWLRFYEAGAIQERQERWEKEGAEEPPAVGEN
jgi:HEAT repeat protein